MDTFPFSDVHRGLTRSCPSQLRHFWKERMVVSLTCRKERYHIVTFIFLFCLNTIYKLDEGVIRIFKNARAIDIICKEVQSDFNESSRFVTKLQNRAENRRVTNFNNFTNFSSRLHVSRYFWRRVFFFQRSSFPSRLKRRFWKPKTQVFKSVPQSGRL